MAKKVNDDSKLWAFLGVFLTLLGFLLVFFVKKEDKYAMYYAKQGLVLFLGWVVLSVVSWIPILGWIVYYIGAVLLLIAWIVILVASLSGEKKTFPVVSEIASNINL